VARVRERVRQRCGDEVARRLPPGYHRLGRVLLLRLPPEIEPYLGEIGNAYQAALQVDTVLNRRGPELGEFRLPQVELIAGSGTEAEVREFGIRYRLDAAQVMFARGNRTERHRAGELTRPGDTVVDLFAGVGYFALPAAVLGQARTVFAVEKNPIAFEYLRQNVRINRVEDQVVTLFGDNRQVDLPTGSADRVFLGYLPSSLPWVARAVSLLQPDGGWLHVHLLGGTRAGLAGVRDEVLTTVNQSGRRVLTACPREIKAYGPGRVHAVVDVEISAWR